MTRVSIVIRCFNEAKHIGRLLEGITLQTKAADEIVIVDSGSTDRTLDIARRYPVKVVEISPDEFSFGRSLNRGFEASSGEVIVAASAHVYPLFDTWLETLTDPFSDALIAVAYGRQQGDERSRFSEQQVFAKWFPTRSVLYQDHPFCNNANAAVRRSVWEELPYDEALTGLEDLDLAKRAMAIGYRVSYCGAAVVAHIHDETRRQIENRYRREAIAHRAIFPDQGMSLMEAARLATGNILCDYAQAHREGKLLAHLVDIASFRTAQFWGSYQGFSQKGPVTRTLRRRFYYPNGLHRAADDEPVTGRLIRYERPAKDVQTSETQPGARAA